MDTPAAPTLDVDLHRLELRFADTRLLEPRAVEALARSIERSGQLMACIAVPEAGGERLVLVDGYRRVLALRRLGRDTAQVQSWACDLAQALLRLLAQAGARPFAALEEALLLRELVHGQGLSEREVARRSGRDVSWVSRRLELVCGLSDTVLAALRKGDVSCWVATRVLAPLARANAAHAAKLLDALAATPLSSRQLQSWFQHYQRSPSQARERMVSHPRLFLQSLQAQEEQRADTRLRDGPEGQLAADVRQMLALIKRCRLGLSTLPASCLPDPLQSALSQLRGALDGLQGALARSLDHDPQPHPRCRADPQSPGAQPARHQPGAETLA